MPACARPRLRLGISIQLSSVLLTLAIVSVGACSSNAASPSAPAGLKIVATTTVFADIVATSRGDRGMVASIIPPGAGPEDYEPKPDDARKLDGADLIVSNGVGLDDFLDACWPRARAATRLGWCSATASPRSSSTGRTTRTSGSIRPLWRYYLPAIVAKLGAIDPAGAAAYQANADAYSAELTALDAELAKEVDTIPTENRKLVTFHDAFPYFARHYGFELIGVILANPGQEPSAGRARQARRHRQGDRREGRVQRSPVQPGLRRDAGPGGRHHQGRHHPL